MEDAEIYQLAEDLIRGIVEDLNDSVYADLGGRLSARWSTGRHFNAWAESARKPTEPPKHVIGLHYELARTIYRDCEAFCDFAESDLQRDVYQDLLSTFDHRPGLPNCFTKAVSVRNMFLASISWVFFHELGHLAQEHGYIRASFAGGSADGSSTIRECEVTTRVTLVGQAAALHHVTELAADFEGNFACILELVRHFTDKRIVGMEFDGTAFLGASYLLVCGLTCIF